MRLSDAKCRNAAPREKLFKLSDGGGLQLWVQPTGSRLWRVAYRYQGKQKLLALGSYPIVTLAKAREARDDAKRLLADGIDPGVHRKANAEKAQATFKAVADEYLDKLHKEGRTENTLNKVGWLLSFAHAEFGDTPIAALDAPAILVALQGVEARGRYETAHRLRSTIGAVFRYAIATGRATIDPTQALKGALVRRPVQSYAAITKPKPFGALLRAIDGFEGQPATHAALKLMPLLFPRPGELRQAAWPEFDLNEGVWTVPSARMKMRLEHRVPLSKQALSVLKDLKAVTGRSALVFPSVRSVDRPISDGTLNAALRRLGYGKDEVTAHGFRASASTLLNESGKWHPDAIERQLAHVESDDVRRAYARGDHWPERKRMMQWWANYLDTLKKAGR